MDRSDRLYGYRFSDVYGLYLSKVSRKGRSREELDRVICWLTGYDAAGLERQIAGGADLRAFFEAAPAIHPCAVKITGTICGVRLEEIRDPLTQRIRWMDKLVDELARGRAMEKILRG